MSFFSKIIVLLLFVVTSSISYADGHVSDLPMLVCPDVNQLQVTDGGASAPNGWVGTSNIPQKIKNIWRLTMGSIFTQTLGDKAECEYYSPVAGAYIIDIFKEPLLPNYYLFDTAIGVQPVPTCWVPTAQLNSGEYKECYWYSNPVS